MSDKPLNQYACTRCRRLKKKCSKEFPKCANCRKQNKVCEYVERKNKRKRPQPGNGPSKNGSILNGSGFNGTEPPENNNAQIHTQNNNNENNHLGSGGANLAAMPIGRLLRAFQAPMPLQPQASQSPLGALTAAAPGQPARATSIFSAPGALSTMGPPSIISAPGAGSVIGATNGPPHPGSIAGSAASTTLLPPLGIYSMRQQQSALRGTQKASAPVLNNISSAGDGTLPRIPPVLPLPPALSSSLPQISPMGRGTASFDSSTTFSSSVMQNANNASLVSSSISSQTPDGKEVGASASSGAGAGANANIGAHAQAAPVSSMVNTDEACEKSASAALTASAKSSAHPALNAPATSGAPLAHAAAAQKFSGGADFCEPVHNGFISSMKTHKPISPQTNFSASFWPLGSASRSEDSCNTEIVRSMIGLETAHMIEPPSEPTRTVMAAALDAYFAHTQREYPFLEEKVVRRRAHSLHFAGEPSGPALAAAPTAELLLVLALGCRVLESAGTASKVQRYPEFFIRRAQKTLEGPGIALTGVEAVRILALYCAYLVYGTQIAHCWMAVGALGRLVLAANLHRRPGANVRVLFAAYSLDRMVSLTLGRPVCIGDDDVDASLPLRRREESQADIEISKRIIEMYRVEGLIMQNIHAARAVESFGTAEDRRAIYDALRKEVEAWYGRCRGYRAQLAKSALSGMQGGMPGASRTPMHNPTAWFNAEYYNLLIALYKPCRLCAHPAPEIMDLLGRCALQALSFSYSIYTSTWFPCSWVRTNLPLAREMLDYFASTWPYASQLATVLAKVACCLDDVAQIRQLAVKYQRILTDNSVNLWVEDVGYLDCRS
ncbi:hypothetical protein HII13_002033 [Brettanomyces bruxellensis]|nr:hypothetical protein HII13_002033 [Brettanomyces bruxellensis]